MEKIKKRKSSISILVVLTMCMALFFTGCGKGDINKQIEDTVSDVKELNPTASVGSVGGEWAVKGVKASGISLDDEQSYFTTYFDDVRATVKSEKGVLDEKYYTEYARVTIGVCAVGENPENIEGYNIVKPLDNYKKVTDQGNNAVAFAIIASNVAGVKLENEQKYIDILTDEIVKNKAYKTENIVDYGAMYLQGLSYYKEDKKVKSAIDQCVDGLSDKQQKDGSYGNCESTVEVIIGLTSVGVDPVNDKRFIKDGNSLYDGLMRYKTDGGFKHTVDEDSDDPNVMATEKALLALDSIKLLEKNEKLYQEKR